MNTSDIEVGIGLLGLHVISTHTVLASLDAGLEHTQAVPLHGLAAAEQLHHDGGELLDNTLDDVSRVHGLRECHALNQTAERQGLRTPGDRKELSVDAGVRISVLPVGYGELNNFSCHNFNPYLYIMNIQVTRRLSRCLFSPTYSM